MSDRELLPVDQVTHGIHSIFSFAGAYNLFQRLLGAREAKIRFIREFVLPFPGAKVLDIGCGTGAIMAYLPGTIEYVGFDSNPNYIAYAKKKYEGRGTFFHDRVSGAAVGRRNEFDLVLAIGILHHLNDDEARKLFAMAYECLRPSGSLVTFDNVYVKNQSAVARYIISKDRGKHVRTPEQYTALANSSFNEVRNHIIHDMLRIPYTHFIMKCFK